MTQVAQIFEEEKQQALQQSVKDTSKQIVIKMIKKNYPSEEIASLVPSYSQNDVDELRKEVAGEETLNETLGLNRNLGEILNSS